MVVVPAVEDEGITFIVDLGLVAALEIDDTETAHAEDEAGAFEDADVIGSELVDIVR